MIKAKGNYWLDEKGVRQAVKQATTLPLVKCGAAVEREAKSSMKSGRKGQGNVGKSSEPGTPPNIQNNHLRGSIKTAVDSGSSVVVGPTRMAFYGKYQEFGAVIKVTAKMRAFLAWKFGWHLKQSTKKIHLPPRPFMRPALAMAMKNFPQFFKGMNLGGTPAGRILNSRKTKR